MLSSEDLEQSPLYSEALGIDLASRREEAVFAWFLASQLYGGRIAESIAERTYGVFAAEGLLSPDAIIAAGRERLINPVMRRGGYVRYDNRKIDQILRACHTIALSTPRSCGCRGATPRFRGTAAHLHQK